MITKEFVSKFNKTFKTDFKLGPLLSGRLPDSIFTSDNLSYIYKESGKYMVRLISKNYECSFYCTVDRLVIEDIIEGFRKNIEYDLKRAEEVYGRSLKILEGI